MRAFLTAALLLPLAVALGPSALAQEEPVAGRPDDAAWVEDCPPEALCAASAPPPSEDEAPRPEERNAVPAASLAAALGILAVASLGVALLPRA